MDRTLRRDLDDGANAVVFRFVDVMRIVEGSVGGGRREHRLQDVVHRQGKPWRPTLCGSLRSLAGPGSFGGTPAFRAPLRRGRPGSHATAASTLREAAAAALHAGAAVP